jgi:hypothetical protein
MSTMGMQVELSMTAKGVQATLKDAQGAVLQTASIIKTQLPGATEDASKGLAKFKEGLGRSRETMMFFTKSLGELGPAGQTAQMAISGLGSAFLGGGVVGLGLAAAQVGMRLLGDAMDAEAKKAEEAKKKNDEVFKKLIDDANAAAKAVQDFNSKAHGVDAQDSALARGSAELQPSIDKAKAEMKAKADALAKLQEQQDAGRAYSGQQADIDTAAEQVRIAERTYDDLLDKQRAFEERRKQIAMTSAVEIENARAAADDEAQRQREAKAKEKIDKEKAEYDRKYQLFYGHLDRVARAGEKADEAADKRREKRDEQGQANLDAKARKYEASQKKMAQDLDASMQPIAAGMQQIFDRVILGGENMGVVLQSIFKSALSMIFSQLIQAGINALIAHVMQTPVKVAEATSQAGLVGAGTAAAMATNPITAMAAIPAGVAAMEAAMAAFVPVAAASGGFDVGNYSPVTQLHPREMVLPANIADPLRQSLAGRGGLGGGVTVNISAVDAKGVRRLLMDNQPALAEAIGKAIRDGRRFA